MRNIVILISGNGSNMTAIVNTAQRDDWSTKYGARLAAVISNQSSCQRLNVFTPRTGHCHRGAGPQAFSSRKAFDHALVPASLTSIMCRVESVMVVNSGLLCVFSGPTLWRVTADG